MLLIKILAYWSLISNIAIILIKPYREYMVRYLKKVGQTNLYKRCPRCGSYINVGDNYCRYCSHKLTEKSCHKNFCQNGRKHLFEPVLNYIRSK